MFAFDDWKRNINEYCKKYSRVVFSVCHSESFSLAQKADCVFVFGGLEVFQFFCLTKSCHLTLLLTSSLPPPPGCLDRLFICPAWARKGYCESKRRLMQKHCPSSCDFCYGKKQQWQRHQESRGKEKKKKTEKVFSQLSSIRSCCEPFANGATGANRSSHAELRWRISRVWFVGRLHLALGESVFYFWRVAAFQNAHTAGPLPVDCSLSEGCFTQVSLIRQLPL